MDINDVTELSKQKAEKNIEIQGGFLVPVYAIAETDEQNWVKRFTNTNLKEVDIIENSTISRTHGFNEKLLEKIADLRDFINVNGTDSDVYTKPLGALRHVRNSERGLTFEEGKAEEDEWMKKRSNLVLGEIGETNKYKVFTNNEFSIELAPIDAVITKFKINDEEYVQMKY